MKERDFQQPNRSLSLDFTDTTLRSAIAAKRRNDRYQAIKELFTMENKRNFLKKPIGAFIAFAVVVTGSASVYAAANWFGGVVSVTSNNSTMTVDLSQCQGKILPPGIDEKTDRSNVRFRITGEPHISKTDLQRKLLADCEYQTILTLGHDKYGAISNDVGIIKSISPSHMSMTLEIAYKGKSINKTVSFDQNVGVYDKGQNATLTDLRSGDHVMIAFNIRGPRPIETENLYDRDFIVKSIFKTQYDLREVINDGKSLYGAPNNIMPFEQPQEMQKKGL